MKIRIILLAAITLCIAVSVTANDSIPRRKLGPFIVPSARQEVTTATTGGSVTVNPGVGVLVLNSGSLLAAYTITLPTSPSDQDELIVIFRTAVSVLTFAGSNVQNTGLPGIVAVGTALRFYFDAGSATSPGRWYIE